MEYKEFKQQIQERILDYLPKKYADSQVEIYTVIKNNDTNQDGLLINPDENNIVPTIYLNPFFEDYEQGKGMEDILISIADMRIEHEVERNFDVSRISDYEAVKQNIICRLVNREENNELLQDRPYTPVEDLAVTYHVLLGQNAEGIYSVAVDNALLEKYGKGLTVTELHKIALENTERQCPSKFTSMTKMLQELMQPAIADMKKSMKMDGMDEKAIDQVIEGMLPPDDGNVFVLTNNQGLNGAAAIINPEVQRRIAKELGESYYVLPSSIHETLIVRKSMGMVEDELKDLVRQVNSTRVSPAERLSDSVYVYDADKRELRRGGGDTTKNLEKKKSEVSDREGMKRSRRNKR